MSAQHWWEPMDRNSSYQLTQHDPATDTVSAPTSRRHPNTPVCNQQVLLQLFGTVCACSPTPFPPRHRVAKFPNHGLGLVVQATVAVWAMSRITSVHLGPQDLAQSQSGASSCLSVNRKVPPSGASVLLRAVAGCAMTYMGS